MSPEDSNHPIKNPALRALAHWYARRIVNVNVNIIAAGLLPLVPVSLVVSAFHQRGPDPAAPIPRRRYWGPTAI